MEFTIIYVWLGLAIFFLIAEAVTTSIFSIWFAIGSFAALLVSLALPEAFVLQMIVFIAVTALTLYFTRPILVKKILKKTPTNMDRLIGKTAVVIEEVTPLTVGRAKSDGLLWQIKSEDTISVGEKCDIVKIEGVSLIVKKQEVKV